MNRFFLLSVAALALVGGVASATQLTLPLRFDMGPSGAPLAPGFMPVTAADDYSEAQGYGWRFTGAAPTDELRAEVPQQIVHEHDDELLIDFVQRDVSLVFQLKLAASTPYLCMVYVGDVDNAHQGLRVLANGTAVATEVAARTIKLKAAFMQSHGGYRRVTFKAETDANGTLAIGVDDLDGIDDSVPIMGIEIYDYVQPPIEFLHATKGIAATGSVDSHIAAGIAAYNTHDYVNAASEFGMSTNALDRAWGRAFVVGALTSDMEQVDIGPLHGSGIPGLLDDVLTDLVAVGDMDNSAARSLYVEARDLRTGVLFDRTRGYTHAAFPDNPDSLGGLGLGDGILLNLNAAAQLFEQMHDDVLDPNPDPNAAESPLYPVSLYLLGRNLFSRNTQLFTSDPQVDLEQVLYLMDILVNRIWPAVDPSLPLVDRRFPDAHEAIVLCWTLKELAEDFENLPDPPPKKLLTGEPQYGGGVYGAWQKAGKPLPSFDPEDTWWSDSVHLPAPTISVPAHAKWAEAQRKYAYQYRNAARWWVLERLYAKELGGGSGDDVEFPLLAAMTGRRESADNPFVEAPLSGVYDRVLYENPSVSSAEGYTKEAGDVEHTAEPTTFPLVLLVPMNYGNPRYYEFVMRMVRNMEDAHQSGTGSPNAWTVGGTGSFGAIRHFRSWKIGGTTPPGLLTNENQDVPLNLKALGPATTLLDYNQSAEVARLLEEYAWAWRDAAMRTDNSKPIGIFPGSVTVAANGTPGAIGQDGLWYRSGLNTETPFDFDFPMGATVQTMGQLYGLLTEVRRRSTHLNADALLDPLVQMLSVVPTESAHFSTAEGAAWKLKDALVAAIADAEADLLAVGADPQEIATWLGYGTTATNDNYQAGYEEADEFMRYLWPHATTLVRYVDRIRFASLARNRMFEHATGASLSLTPGYVVTWENPASSASAQEGDELDVGIWVSHYQRTEEGATNGALDVLLYNFKTTTSTLDMRIWRGLGLGDYDLQFAEADSNNEYPTPPSASLFVLDHRGQEHSVVLEPDKLYLLRLTQTSNAMPAAPTFDLALSSHVGLIGANGRLNLNISNIGVTDYPPPGPALPMTINVMVNGVPFDSKTVTKSIDAPESAVPKLSPSSVRVVMDGNYTNLNADDVLTISLIVSGNQITLVNDSVQRRFGDIPQL